MQDEVLTTVLVKIQVFVECETYLWVSSVSHVTGQYCVHVWGQAIYLDCLAQRMLGTAHPLIQGQI